MLKYLINYYIFFVTGLAAWLLFASIFLMFLFAGAAAGFVLLTGLLLSARICGATFTTSSLVQPPITVLHSANATCAVNNVTAASKIPNFNLISVCLTGLTGQPQQMLRLI